MEDLLPEARRKALETPFPALPNALVDLLTEQGEEVSIEEAATFISEFRAQADTTCAAAAQKLGWSQS